MASTIGIDVHFGGPDAMPGHLRDILAERVAAVPAGGSIDWVTYYFRDRRLAHDLIEARERGVDVRVTLDGHPRTARANDRVIDLLESGLGDGLRVVRSSLDRLFAAPLFRPRVHEKLYCFSHPRPVALVGSFNPSTDNPERDPAILEEIGDHTFGYNMLVELADEALVSRVTAHARSIHGKSDNGLLARFNLASNRGYGGKGSELHFWPRVTAHPIERMLKALPPGSRVRIAASHLKGAHTTRLFLALARRGLTIEILAEDSQRRVPLKIEHRLRSAGIRIQRVVHSEMSWTPMHNKFLLIECGGRRTAVIGSFNWNAQSRYLNRELGVSSDDADLFETLSQRWDMLQKYAV